MLLFKAVGCTKDSLWTSEISWNSDFGLVSNEKKTYYMYYSKCSLSINSDFTDFVGWLTWKSKWEKVIFYIISHNLNREQNADVYQKPWKCTESSNLSLSLRIYAQETVMNVIKDFAVRKFFTAKSRKQLKFLAIGTWLSNSSIKISVQVLKIML